LVARGLGVFVFIAIAVVDGIIRTKVWVGVGVIEAVWVGRGVTLGVSVFGIMACVCAAAAPAVSAMEVLNVSGSRVGPLNRTGAATAGWEVCATAAVWKEAATAVSAMAVFKENGSSVGTGDSDKDGAQENPSSATATINQVRFLALTA
jgi:hypothetical protein